MPVKFTGLRWAPVLGEVKHGWCPQDEDPHRGLAEPHKRGTMPRQRRLCFLFLSLSADLHWRWFHEPSSVTFNPAQQGGTERPSRCLQIHSLRLQQPSGFHRCTKALSLYFDIHIFLLRPNILCRTLMLQPKATQVVSERKTRK